MQAPLKLFRVNGEGVSARSAADAREMYIKSLSPREDEEGVIEVEVTPETVVVASFDADGRYWGPKVVPVNELKSTSVILDPDILDSQVPAGAVLHREGCDLGPGKHKYDYFHKCFVPLPRHEHKDSPAAPDFQRAMYDFWWMLHVTGAELPEYTIQWMLWYEVSVDHGKTDQRLHRALGISPDRTATR